MSLSPSIIRFALFALFVLLLCCGSLAAAKPLVLSSIRPLHLIAVELAGDAADARLLLPENVSPHLYQLKPSDRRLLQQADRVFWIGPELERFLEKPVALLDTGAPIALLHTQGISLIDDAHDGHDHQGIDPHIWLNVDNVRVIAQRMMNELIELDPAGGPTYQRNLRSFLDKLAQVDQQAVIRLKPLTGRGYVLLHDGYSHFEERYGLRRQAAFSISPDRKPGARHLLAMRKLLDSGKVVCIFREPQYQPAVLDSIVGDRAIEEGLLDPLASQAMDYAEFYEKFTMDFERCLSVSKNR